MQENVKYEDIKTSGAARKKRNMRTKTKYKCFLVSSELCAWIDQMYAKHGKEIVNVSISCQSGYYYGFITILQNQEQINID